MSIHDNCTTNCGSTDCVNFLDDDAVTFCLTANNYDLPEVIIDPLHDGPVYGPQRKRGKGHKYRKH